MTNICEKFICMVSFYAIVVACISQLLSHLRYDHFVSCLNLQISHPMRLLVCSHQSTLLVQYKILAFSISFSTRSLNQRCSAPYVISASALCLRSIVRLLQSLSILIPCGIGKSVTTQLAQGPSTARGDGTVIRSSNQRLAGLFPAQDNAINSSSWLFNVLKQVLLWTTYYRNDPMEYGLAVQPRKQMLLLQA